MRLNVSAQASAERGDREQHYRSRRVACSGLLCGSLSRLPHGLRYCFLGELGTTCNPSYIPGLDVGADG